MQISTFEKYNFNAAEKAASNEIYNNSTAVEKSTAYEIYNNSTAVEKSTAVRTSLKFHSYEIYNNFTAPEKSGAVGIITKIISKDNSDNINLEDIQNKIFSLSYIQNNKFYGYYENKKYVCDKITCRQYEEYKNNKFCKNANKLRFANVAINKYIKNSSYGNCVKTSNINGYNSIYFEQKIFMENNINFNCNNLQYTTIYYDIETYNENNYMDVPDVNNKLSHIGMLCMYILALDFSSAVVLLSKKYIYDKNEILKKITNLDKLEILEFENENLLSQYFVKFINDIQNLKFLIGFNSSVDYNNDDDKYNNKHIGYDLSFLLDRSNFNYKLNLKYGVKIFKSNTAKQVINCDILRDTFIIDMSCLLFNDLLPDEHKQLDNYKLDSYLILNKIQCKLEHNYEDLQYRLHKNITDITDIISYCLYDCIALHNLLIKRNLINKLIEWSQLLNLPLNHIIYNTQANFIKLYIIRKYFENNLICHYDINTTDAELCHYQGAITILPTNENLYKPMNIMGTDFSSLYPSTIMQHNISPETVYVNKLKNKNFNILKVDDNENKNIKELYVVSEIGIIPKIINDLYNLRMNIKQQMEIIDDTTQNYKLLDLKQYTIKIGMNTMYGLMGNQNNNILFNKYAALLITNEARNNILFLQQILINKQCEVIFMDTDSCFIKNIFNTLTQHKNFVNDINAMLKLRSINLKIDVELYYRTIFINKKKSHMEFIVPSKEYKNYYENQINIDKYKLSIKGIQWSNISNVLKVDLKSLIKNIMLSCENLDDIREFIKLYIYTHHNIINDAIKNCDIKTLENYAKRIRLSGSKNLMSQIIKSKYNIMDAYCYVLELNDMYCKRKSDRVIPSSCVNNDNIKLLKIQSMLTNISDPLKKLFDYQINKLYEKYNFVDDHELIIYRVDSFNKTTKNIITAKYQTNFYKLEKEIKKYGNTRSYNELIINLYNKLFFDIESTSEINLNHFISFLNTEILQDFNIPIHICSANKINKFSYHVVCDIKISLEYNLNIATLYNKKYFIICDLSVYSINKTIRLPNCCKIKTANLNQKFKNINDIWENRQFKIISQSTLKNFILTDTQNINDELIQPLIYNNSSIHDIGTWESVDIANAMVKASIIKFCKNENLNTNISIKNNYIHINVIGKYHCCLCNRDHDSDNLYAYVKHSMCYVDCYRNKASLSKVSPLMLDIIDNEYDETLALLKKINGVKQYCLEKEHEIKMSLNCINQPILNFSIIDIFEKYIFIKSDLGTGKTTCLKNDMKFIDENKVMLVISFRITFANDFARKFNMTSYQEIKGNIYNDQNKKIVLQIDSLLRYIDKLNIDILICDEIESILTQLYDMKKNKNSDALLIYQRFIKLIKQSKKCIFMDGLLEYSTINFIKYMCNINSDDIKFINNIYKPKYDHKIIISIIHQKKPTELECIMNDIIINVINGKKIAVFSQSSSFAHTFEQYILLQNYNFNILIYTGRDLNYNGQDFMKNKKYKDILKMGIDNVLTELNCNLFIYTSTITAGISINYNFDMLYHINCPNTNDILSTFQALHRVRNLNDKIIKSYIVLKQFIEPCTCNQLYESIYNYDESYNNKLFEFELFLNARKNSLMVYEFELFIKYLTCSGYNIDIHPLININNTTSEIFLNASIYGNPIAKFKHIIKQIGGPVPHNELLNELPNILQEDIITLDKIKNIEYIQLDDTCDARTLEFKLIIYKKCKLLSIDPLTYKTIENITKMYNVLTVSKEKKLINKKKGDYILNKYSSIDEYNIHIDNKNKESYNAEINNLEIKRQVNIIDEKKNIKNINIAEQIINKFGNNVYDRDQYNEHMAEIFKNNNMKFTKKSLCHVNDMLSYVGKEMKVYIKRTNKTEFRKYEIINSAAGIPASE